MANPLLGDNTLNLNNNNFGSNRLKNPALNNDSAERDFKAVFKDGEKATAEKRRSESKSSAPARQNDVVEKNPKNKASDSQKDSAEEQGQSATAAGNRVAKAENPATTKSSESTGDIAQTGLNNAGEGKNEDIAAGEAIVTDTILGVNGIPTDPQQRVDSGNALIVEPVFENTQPLKPEPLLERSPVIDDSGLNPTADLIPQPAATEALRVSAVEATRIPLATGDTAAGGNGKSLPPGLTDPVQESTVTPSSIGDSNTAAIASAVVGNDKSTAAKPALSPLSTAKVGANNVESTTTSVDAEAPSLNQTSTLKNPTNSTANLSNPVAISQGAKADVDTAAINSLTTGAEPGAETGSRTESLAVAGENRPNPAVQALQRATLNSGDPVQTAVATDFDNPTWGKLIGEKIVQLAQQRIQVAEIHIDPPELGPVQVRIAVNQENAAAVSFISAHASVRETLDINAIRLRELFTAEGLDLVDVNVSDQSPNQSFGNRAQTNVGVFHSENESEQEIIPATYRVATNPNLVDYFI